jgi:hypothetical protein
MGRGAHPIFPRKPFSEGDIVRRGETSQPALETGAETRSQMSETRGRMSSAGIVTAIIVSGECP